MLRSTFVGSGIARKQLRMTSYANSEDAKQLSKNAKLDECIHAQKKADHYELCAFLSLDCARMLPWYASTRIAASQTVSGGPETVDFEAFSLCDLLDPEESV